MNTKLTFSELKNFKNMSPVSHKEQQEYIGGGNGSGISTAYSLSEYEELGYSFTKGWVRFSDDDVRYLTQDYYSYCGGSSYSGSDYSGTSGYGGSTDYSGSSYSGSSDYSGSSYYNELNDIYQQISNLVSQLPSCIRDALKYVNIEYDSELGSAGRYYAAANTIALKDITYDTLYRECIHVVQQEYHLGGTNHSALEFQEAVIGDLMGMKEGIAGNMRGGDSDEYGYWMANCIDEHGEIDVCEFINGVERFLPEFQAKYPNASGYQGSVPSDYNYNWAEMLWRLGLTDTGAPWK